MKQATTNVESLQTLMLRERSVIIARGNWNKSNRIYRTNADCEGRIILARASTKSTICCVTSVIRTLSNHSFLSFLFFSATSPLFFFLCFPYPSVVVYITVRLDSPKLSVVSSVICGISSSFYFLSSEARPSTNIS